MLKLRRFLSQDEQQKRQIGIFFCDRFIKVKNSYFPRQYNRSLPKLTRQLIKCNKPIQIVINEKYD